MTLRATFRHRASKSESVSARHAQLIPLLGASLGAWLGEVRLSSVFFDGDDVSGAADLTPALPPPSRGAISYCPRRTIDREHGMYDDVLTLDFERDQALYRRLAGGAFGQIVEAFCAYRAAVVIDEDLDLDDFDEIVRQSEESGMDLDGRDRVFRIWPVSFFDDQLCRHAFSLSPNEIALRIASEVERVTVTPRGLEVIATFELVEAEKVESIDQELRSLILV